MRNTLTAAICVTVLTSGLVFSACQPQPMEPGSTDTTTTNLQQKSGDTTKTGTVTGSEGAFFLQVAGEPPLAIDSYSLNLSEYAGKQVTVTGQYSGNTLFIGSVQ